MSSDAGVGVAVGVFVETGLPRESPAGVAVGVTVGVAVGVTVGVAVGVTVGAAVGFYGHEEL